ncbi:hypothetical protein CLF_103026 [Clonorchis sinensis]|uniref:Uncharacterized protein n=1 Tax=Clonorchis sinensis TaxID=79923 RepID=G7Y8X5_CLOSI|nr:hypothetical protein CLF_103026 [Clonorchis sinensis]
MLYEADGLLACGVYIHFNVNRPYTVYLSVAYTQHTADQKMLYEADGLLACGVYIHFNVNRIRIKKSNIVRMINEWELPASILTSRVRRQTKNFKQHINNEVEDERPAVFSTYCVEADLFDCSWKYSTHCLGRRMKERIIILPFLHVVSLILDRLTKTAVAFSEGLLHFLGLQNPTAFPVIAGCCFYSASSRTHVTSQCRLLSAVIDGPQQMWAKWLSIEPIPDGNIGASSPCSHFSLSEQSLMIGKTTMSEIVVHTCLRRITVPWCFHSVHNTLTTPILFVTFFIPFHHVKRHLPSMYFPQHDFVLCGRKARAEGMDDFGHLFTWHLRLLVFKNMNNMVCVFQVHKVPAIRGPIIEVLETFQSSSHYPIYNEIEHPFRTPFARRLTMNSPHTFTRS